MSKCIPGYHYIKKLGQGGFGTVNLYRDRKNQRVAIKEISYAIRGRNLYDDVIREVEIVLQLDHPRVIHFLDYFIIKERKMLYIVMEYAQHGSLRQLLHDRRYAQMFYFTQKEVLSYTYDIMIGVNYLHERKILHRDLKPGNLLIWSDGRLKICDFGIAHGFYEAAEGLGTPLYMAPEVFKTRRHDKISDIWSIGIIFYEMCTLTHPFEPVKNYQELLCKMTHGQYPAINCKALGYHFGMQEIVRSMIVTDRLQRKSLNQILAHYLFNL